MSQVTVKNKAGYVISVMIEARRQHYQFSPGKGEELVPGQFTQFYKKDGVPLGDSTNYTIEQEDPPLLEPKLHIYVNGGVKGETYKTIDLDLSKSYTVTTGGTICKPKYSINVK